MITKVTIKDMAKAVKVITKGGKAKVKAREDNPVARGGTIKVDTTKGATIKEVTAKGDTTREGIIKEGMGKVKEARVITSTAKVIVNKVMVRDKGSRDSQDSRDSRDSRDSQYSQYSQYSRDRQRRHKFKDKHQRHKLGKEPKGMVKDMAKAIIRATIKQGREDNREAIIKDMDKGDITKGTRNRDKGKGRDKDNIKDTIRDTKIMDKVRDKGGAKITVNKVMVKIIRVTTRTIKVASLVLTDNREQVSNRPF